MFDRYTKTLMTIMAVGLWVLILQNLELPSPANAEVAGMDSLELQLDPDFKTAVEKIANLAVHKQMLFYAPNLDALSQSAVELVMTDLSLRFMMEEIAREVATEVAFQVAENVVTNKLMLCSVYVIGSGPHGELNC